MKFRFAFVIIVIAFAGCVQKTYNKTVVFRVNVPSKEKITSVGVRGGDSPLSWNKDSSLNAVYPGSVYESVITFQTGYKFTEVKFTLNGEIELKDQDNRRIIFGDGDTTLFTAVYDKPNQ